MSIRTYVAALCIGVCNATVAVAGGTAGGASWDGFYVGAHGGWATGDMNWTYLTGAADLGGPLGTTESHGIDGWLGGAQIGYQHRFDRFVAGIEVSYSGGDFLRDTTSITSFDVDEVVTTKMGGLFLATGRLGLVVDPRFMIYVKGGYASSTVDVSTFDPTAFGAAVSAAARTKERHDGWTIGGGLEYALASNLTLGFEYSYIDLGSERHATRSLASDGVQFNYDLDVDPDPIHAVSLRLNFQLGGHRMVEAPAPLK